MIEYSNSNLNILLRFKWSNTRIQIPDTEFESQILISQQTFQADIHRTIHKDPILSPIRSNFHEEENDPSSPDPINYYNSSQTNRYKGYTYRIREEKWIYGSRYECAAAQSSQVVHPATRERNDARGTSGMVSIIVDNSAPFPSYGSSSRKFASPSPQDYPVREIPISTPCLCSTLIFDDSTSTVPCSFVFELLPTCLELYTNIPREYSVFLPFFSFKRGISFINNKILVFLAIYLYGSIRLAMNGRAFVCNFSRCNYISRYNFVNIENFVTLVSSCLSFQNARFRQSGRAPGFKVESDNRSWSPGMNCQARAGACTTRATNSFWSTSEYILFAEYRSNNSYIQ